MQRFIRIHQDIAPTREEDFAGKRHFVVPTIGLVEGVLQAANAPFPELTIADEFGRFQGAEWNGRPVTLGHPQRNGEFVSASGNPKIFQDEKVGFIFNARVEDGKLKMDLFLDPELMPDGEVERILEERVLEVSTGFFASVDAERGNFEGRDFIGIQRGIVPDHIAILAEGDIGACSVEDGCGTNRVNTLVMNKEGKVSLKLEDKKNCACGGEEVCRCEKGRDKNISESEDALAQNLLDITESVSNVGGESRKNAAGLSKIIAQGLEMLKGDTMSEKDKLIEKVITNEASPFNGADKEALETFSFDRLEEFAKMDKEVEQAGAAFDSLEDAEAELEAQSPEDFLANGSMPDEVRDFLSRALAQEKAQKNSYIAKLSACKELPYNSVQLEEKSLDELKGLVGFIEKIDQTDFAVNSAVAQEKTVSLGRPLVNDRVQN